MSLTSSDIPAGWLKLSIDGEKLGENPGNILVKSGRGLTMTSTAAPPLALKVMRVSVRIRLRSTAAPYVCPVLPIIASKYRHRR